MSVSVRKRRGSALSNSPNNDREHQKKCEKKCCDTVRPYCFVQASERCAKAGYTARWNHLSLGQHFCNECFEHFYRKNKPGYPSYARWCARWERESGDIISASPKPFFADLHLPFWVQCGQPGCGKWRKLPANIDLCHVRQDIVKCLNCDQPEEELVALSKDREWASTITYTPLLRHSPLTALLREYFPDGVGISPSITTHSLAKNPGVSATDGTSGSSPSSPAISSFPDPSKELVEDILHPFNHPQEGPRARAFTPDVLEEEEIKAFPGLSGSQSSVADLYMIIRNLLLALWYSKCTEYLSPSSCQSSLSLRGLARIWCAEQLPNVLHLLTKLAYLNCGYLPSAPRPFTFISNLDKKSTVLIIGAGAAGIAAAHHLSNFGHRVKILEANSRIGGRVMDDFSMGSCVGLGAMFITGVCNNPFTLLSRQMDLHVRSIDEDHCDLISEFGSYVVKEMDVKVEKHFNDTLDRLSEWRSAEDTVDESLESKLSQLHEDILAGQASYAEEEWRLLDFHYSNLEFACGATLDKISAVHWDHNDTFYQFSGSHALISEGFSTVLTKLSSSLDIELNTVVTRVQTLEDGQMCLVDTKGREWVANKVIVTVPLSLLKRGAITFAPPLSDRKLKAINSLGAGLVEKVVLNFPAPFWRGFIGNADFFGHVSTTSQHRGMFGVFYDMSPKHPHTNTPTTSSSAHSIGPPYILVTTVSGHALSEYREMKDRDVVDLCVRTLERMFPSVTVPKPLGHLLSRWGADPCAMMSYSYVAVGGSGEDYDIMAEEVDGRVFFAGEATNRQHPQTVTGAYLSGIREACKIIDAEGTF
eukprot:Em0005g1571a